MDDGILTRNLDAIARQDQGALASFRAILDRPLPSGLEVESTPTGRPTLAVVSERGRRVYLHSRVDPDRDAARLVRDLEIGPLDSVVAMGLGLGHHLEALADRLGRENSVLVFERDPAILALALRHVDLSRLLARTRVHFVVGDDLDAAREALAARQTALLAARTHLLGLPAALAAFPAFYETRRRLLRDFFTTAQVSLQTAFALARGNFAERSANLIDYVLSPGVLPFRDRFRGHPGFVVSAGPSLRLNMHHLREVGHRGLVVSVGTALKPLLAAGIRPHFVCALDYSPLAAKYFEGVPAADAPPLVCDVKANARTIGAYPGPRLYAGEELADLLSERVGGEKGRMNTGATVAQTAYFFALHAGCDPIIFVGQDLSYSHGLIHVPGTGTFTQWRGEIGRFNTLEMREWEYLARYRKTLVEIPGWAGGETGATVLADSLMFTYLRDFETLFRASGVTILDATEGGARKEGTTPMRLEEAIARHARTPLPEAAFQVPPGPRPGEALGALEAALARHLRDARHLIDRYEALADLLGRVERRAARGKDSDRLVDRIHRIRDEVAKPRYRTCYGMFQAIGCSDAFTRNRRDRSIDAGDATGVERQALQASRDREFVEGIRGAARFFREHVGRSLERVRRTRQEAGPS